MRDHQSDAFGRAIQKQWESFAGNKEEFMRQIPGVTSDRRIEPAIPYAWLKVQNTTHYYCTVIHGGRLYEVFSYDDEEWSAKY